MKKEQPAATGIDWHAALNSMWQGIQPALPYLVPLIILMSPLPGRGPRSRKRDPWRTFKFDARRSVLARAGNRCEAAALVFILRCPDEAAEVDHVYHGPSAAPRSSATGRPCTRATTGRSRT